MLNQGVQENYRNTEFLQMEDTLYACVLSRPTLCGPLLCSLPGSYAHGTFQARILE